MSRSNFSYTDVVKDIINSSNSPVLPSSMSREAVNAGAPDEGEWLVKKLREACEITANQKGFKRSREKGIRGYLYGKA